MNKIFTKIATACAGLAMAIGVGVAIGNNANVVPVKAEPSTGRINFGSASGSLNVNGASKSGNDSLGNTWTVTTAGTSSFTANASYAQIGSSNKPASSITFTTTLAQEKAITAFSAKFGGFSGTAGNIALKVGNSTVGSGNLNAGNDVTVNATDATKVGTTLTVTVTGISKGVKAYYIEYTCNTVSQNNPVLSVDSDAVTINTADPTGKKVAASTSGFGGTVSYLWTANNSNVTLQNANTSEVTIVPNTQVGSSSSVTVKAWGGSVTEANAKTKTVNVTLETPKTVAQALTMSGQNNVYTKGIISHIDSVDTGNFGNATYYISDDGSRENELEVYRGFYLENAHFSSTEQIQVGDEVVVFGNIITYGTTIEYAQGNYLISVKSEARLTLSPASIEVTVGTDKTVTAEPSNFAAGAISYAFDSDDCATLSFDGNTITVHGDAVGTHTFTVTGKAGDVDQASAELAVTVVAPYPTNIGRNGYTSYTDTQKFVDGTGSFTITYSDGSNQIKHLGDEGIKLFISDVEVDVNTPVASYKGSNTAKATYTENGHTVTSVNFTINVNAELEVVSFEGVPEYLIIDANDPKHSAEVIVNYKSFNGEPDVTIASSNPSKLIVSYDESNNVFDDTIGMAQFTITAGNTVGQYTVTVSITYGNRTESKSFSVNVRGEAPTQSEGQYTLITSVSDLETGNYVIAGKQESSYYGMTKTVNSSKFAGTTNALTVSNNVLSSTEGDELYYYLSVTGTGNSRTVTIKDTSANKYVKYVSSTNVGFDDNTYNWVVSAGVNGSFRFTASTNDGRALAFRNTNVFGGYATSNLTAQATEYVDVELFKYEEAQSDSFELVNTFVANYMHMNDVSIGNQKDTGACKGDSGYYLTAKRAWNVMATAYTGDDNLQTVFSTSFVDAHARYMAWADACNDAAPFDGNNTVVSTIRAVDNPFGFGTSADSEMITVIVVMSAIATICAGGFFFYRRRKEQQ